MAINYVVQAEIVDIRTDAPLASDSFLVDTNVWGWTTYTRASLGKRGPTRRQSRDCSA